MTFASLAAHKWGPSDEFTQKVSEIAAWTSLTAHLAKAI